MKSPFFLLLLALVLKTSIIQGQTSCKISGEVIDSLSKQVLPFSNIILYNSEKQTNTTQSDKNGFFSFKKVAKGSYILQITYIGYYTKKLPLVISEEENNLKKIILTPEIASLKEITVKATKPFIQQDLDKIILNVSESFMSNAGSGLDVLKNAPFVRVEGNSVSLKNKKVRILLDGKPSVISGDNLESFLLTLPSQSIDVIELISNPGAKYEATGEALINIKTLKMKNLGSNGNLSLGTGLGVYPRYNTGIVYNHKTAKVNFSSTYNYQYIKQYFNFESERTIKSSDSFLSNFSDVERDIRTRNLQFYKAGLDYSLSTKSTIGVLVFGDYNIRNKNLNSSTAIYREISQIDSTIKVKNIGKNIYNNLNFNLNFKHKFSSKKELSIDFDYGNYSINSNESIANEYFKNNSNISLRTPIELNIPLTQPIKLASLKVDYSHTIKSGTFEMGGQIRGTSINTTFDFKQIINNQLIKNTDNSFIYDYFENVSAAYLSFNGTVKKFQYKAGLRVETTDASGENDSKKQVNTQHYWQLFPSLSLQYPLIKDNPISFSFSRRIKRPEYSELNSVLWYKNPFRYNLGNPLLFPSITSAFEVTFNYKQDLTLAFGYSRTNNETTRVPFLLNNNITVYQNQNYKRFEMLTFDIFYDKQIKKWWRTSSGIQYFYSNNLLNNVGLINRAGHSGDIFSNHYFTINKTLKAEITNYFIPAQEIGAYHLLPIGRIDFGIQKSILDKKAELRFQVNDAFNLFTFRYQNSNKLIDLYENSKAESRFFRLSFNYKFGNSNVKIKDRKSIIEKENTRINTNN